MLRFNLPPLACLILLLAGTHESSALSEVLHLTPGRQRVLPAPDILRAAIGDPLVADVKALPDEHQVIVTAKRAGTTDLILWLGETRKQSYTIVVTATSPASFKEAHRLLGNIEGISLRQGGETLLIDGEVYRAGDRKRIQQVLSLFPHALDLTRVNPRAFRQIEHKIRSSLRKAGYLDVHVQRSGQEIFLRGNVRNEKEILHVKALASSIFPGVLTHLQTGSVRSPLLLMDIKLMEVRRNVLGNVGFRWPGRLEAQGNLQFAGGRRQTSVTIGQGATLSLEALLENGQARILSNPKLLCRSGDKATFRAGGEIPIRLIGERNSSVHFKSYGVLLEISAEVRGGNEVFLEIQTRLSDLDPAHAIEGIPGILENQVKTSAHLQFGESVALAGLFENRARKNIAKVPFLGHLPVLGELFKSRSFQENRSEFLMVLSPWPANSHLTVHRDGLRDMNRKMKKTQNDIKLSILD